MKNKLWNLLDFIISILFVIILNKIIVTDLGEYQYGVYSIVLMFNGIIALFDLGLSNILVKYISRESNVDNVSKNISSSFFIYQLMFIFITLIVLTIFYIFDFKNIGELKITSEFVAVSLINLYLNLMAMLFVGILISQEKWKQLVIGSLIYKLVVFLVIVVIVKYEYLPFKLDVITFVFGAASLMKLIFYIFNSRTKLRLNYFFKFDKITFYKHFDYLKYSSFNAISGLCYNQFDKIFVVKYLGVIALGQYTFVMQIINFSYSFFGVMMKIKLPIYSSLHNKLKINELLASVKLDLARNLVTSIALLLIVIFGWEYLAAFYINDSFAMSTNSLACLGFLYLVVRMPELIGFYFLSASAQLKWFSIGTFIISIMFLTFLGRAIDYFGTEGVIVLKIVLTLAIYAPILMRSFHVEKNT